MLTNAMSRIHAGLAVCAVAVLLAAGLPAPSAPAASPAVVGPVPAGMARIWFYRDYEPYGSRNYAPIQLNGALVGHISPDGNAFYRDVAPGRYHIKAISDGMDVNQDRYVELAPGQQAYAKILAAPNWDSGGDQTMYRRDTFYVTLVAPQVAQTELPSHPLTGG